MQKSEPRLVPKWKFDNMWRPDLLLSDGLPDGPIGNRPPHGKLLRVCANLTCMGPRAELLHSNPGLPGLQAAATSAARGQRPQPAVERLPEACSP
jgi:hypothetical protein